MIADELRELTPSVYETEGCGKRLGETATEDRWMRYLALRAKVAVAGHLDRIATALEGVGDPVPAPAGLIAFRDHLADAIARAKHNGGPVPVAAVDLDAESSDALLAVVERAIR
jgi:hypothetical protein